MQAKPFAVSAGFVGTLGLRLVAGHDFSAEGETAVGSVILNESAARWLGEDAVGRTVLVGWLRQPMRVIGVVEDFHYESMRHATGAAFLQLKTQASQY